MSADYNKPTVTDGYSDFPSSVREADAANVRMLGEGSNLPDQAIKLNRTTKHLEEYTSSAGTWAESPIDAETVGGELPSAFADASHTHAHNDTTSRDADDCHPQAAITGLVTALSGKLAAASNLSDLADAATARSNLGLGAAAVESVASGGTGGLLRADGDGSGLTGISTVDTTARADIALAMFTIMVNNGLTVQQMVAGFVDEFEDTTGINAGSSSNESYDSTGYYTNANYSATDIASSATVTVSATDGGSAANIIDDSVSTSWYAAPTCWVKFQLSAEKKIWRYSLTPYLYTDRCPAAWSFQGSNDGTNWTTLHSGTSVSSDWTASTTRYFDIAPSVAYLYYRVNITASCGATYVEFSEIEMFPVDGYLAMTLVSKSVALADQPDNVLVVARVEAESGATINTDYAYQVSRDGGTTFSTVTLEEQFTSGGIAVVSGQADVSGQPIGSGLVLKAVTTATYEIKIHAQCGQGD